MGRKNTTDTTDGANENGETTSATEKKPRQPKRSYAERIAALQLKEQHLFIDADWREIVKLIAANDHRMAVDYAEDMVNRLRGIAQQQNDQSQETATASTQPPSE